MKKAIVLLLALAVLGGAVFAQDAALAVSGYVTSGLKIVNNDAGTTFGIYSDDWGDVGTTAYIDASYTGEKAGFDVTIAGSTGYDNGIDFDSGATVEVDTAYGWISPVEGLKLIAGNWYGGAFDGVDDDSNDYFTNDGVFATYSVAGLTAGAGIAPDADANGHPDFVFGAAYMMADMFKFRFSAQTRSNELDAMSASVSVLAVPGLTLSAGYLATNMTETDNITTLYPEITLNWMDATVGYAISDKLSAKVVGYYYLAKEYLWVGPRVTYKVTDALTVYGQVGYETEGTVANYTNASTVLPRVQLAYTSGAGKLVAQADYDTEAKKATGMLYYVFSF
ncbi:MAG TPA: hypothetical protein VMX33_04250 [bacterium]|nr:hypothetical protein [bacterium]